MFVTVVIPARNEEQYIEECIVSLGKQTYSKDLYEVLLVDGMSTDRTREIAKRVGEEYKINLRIIENKKRVAPVAMNLGIENSKGEVIILIGGHSYVDSEFIEQSVCKLKESGAACVGGPITTISKDRSSEVISLAMSSSFGVGNALFRYSTEEAFVDTVAFGAYRKEIFNKVGNFDEELVRNQDDEMNFRITKSGEKILLSPKIKSYYYSRGSLGKLWKQYFQYGFWKVRVIQKHKRPASIRHLVPLLFVLFLGFGAIGSLFSKVLLAGYLSILGLYLLLDLVESIRLGKSKGFLYVLNLMPIFPILHISYGIGFILGLFNFYIFKSKKVEESNKKMSR